ncbi:hypothetical protein FCV25MIE_21606 [Fagus crenata]
MFWLESTSRQTVLALSIVDERCSLESEMVSHCEPELLQISPSLAGFPNPSTCKHKFVPSSDKLFWLCSSRLQSHYRVRTSMVRVVIFFGHKDQLMGGKLLGAD